MHRSAVLMIAALVLGFVSCSDDEQTSSTTRDQTTVPVEDETTTTTTEDQATSAISLPATSTVTATVTNVENAVGLELAGVLYKGDGPRGPRPDVEVGGFGVDVDADPFATTQVVRAPRPDLGPGDFFPEADWPYVTDEPAMLEPGTYYLLLWVGPPTMCCFGAPWMPSGPGLTGCGTVFTVKDDEQVNITLSGIPPAPSYPGECASSTV